ncbi:hypothetical protein [Roseivirga sp.]|uniref:hypothetical protein n=1 Tax=Roseivirga sp. TaxID=1964215 RepID=UPI003B51E934
MSDQEKKDKRFSIIVSAIIHSALIALFLILVAWREPDPPLPEYGIELNLGFQDAGSGDTERTAETQVEDTEDDTPPDAETETETDPVEEEVQEEVQEEVVEQPKTEVTPVEKVQEETPPVEETVEETVTTEEKSEVKVEEKTPPVTETKEEVTPPKEEVKKEEEVKPVEKKQEETKPVIDNRALMGGKKTNTDNKDNTSNNQGTQSDVTGNQGDPDGKKNTKGTDPGGEDAGVSLSLEGWKWQSPPGKKDDSQVDGVIMFSFDVDDRGRVSNVTKIQGSTIQDNVIVQFYKKQVEELTFVQKDQSVLPKSKSVGRITFVIRTN